MEQQNDKSIVKHTLGISVVVLLGKILGFVKQAVIAWAFGANAVTDIYFAADGYASMFGQIMGQSVGPTVLTRYVKLREEGEKEKALRIIKESFLFFGIIGVIVVSINILFSSSICNLIGISYTVTQKQELRFFLIALCPVMIFTSLSGVAQGYLDANKKFLPAKLCSLFFSFSIIAFVLVFSKQIGVRSLLFGFLFGYVAHTAFMLILSIPKTGLFLGNPFRDSEFRSMMKRFVPLVVGNSIVDIGHLIDKVVASSLVTGSVSSLYYGQVISSDIVNAVIVSAVGTVLLTSITKSVSDGSKLSDIRKKLQNIIGVMIMLSGLLFSLYIVEGTDLVTVFFERGEFDSKSTVIVSSIAVCYAFGFVFISIREVLIKAHYAFQDTITPMINSIVGVVINLIGSIILSMFLGVKGIAIATSVSMAVVSALSLFTIKKHLKAIPIDKRCVINILKVILSTIVAVVAGKAGAYCFGFIPVIVRMIIVSLIVVVVYVFLSILVKEDTVTEYLVKRIKLSNRQ